MASHADGMHGRLVELASGGGASFSIVVTLADVDDALTLADAQGWTFVNTQVHASGSSAQSGSEARAKLRH